MATARAGGLAGEVPVQELIELLPGLGNGPGLARSGVMDEEALIDRHCAFLVAPLRVKGVGGIVANAVGVSQWRRPGFGILADQRLVAESDAILVALRRAVESDSSGLSSPGAPEANKTTVEGPAFAQTVEGRAR